MEQLAFTIMRPKDADRMENRAGQDTMICWASPFVSLGVSGLFCRFNSTFDGKFC